MDTSQTDSIVLEEEIDPNYVPSENEIMEYAKWLGMDLEKDSDLLWISKVMGFSYHLQNQKSFNTTTYPR